MWIEASAVTHEGRANQGSYIYVRITRVSLKNFLNIYIDLPKMNLDENYTVLQLTHSGRYSRPDAEPAPIMLPLIPI